MADEATAPVLDLKALIARNQRAIAIERAWDVAKALEGDHAQVEGLRWIEPQHEEGKGISRPVDFSRYLTEATPLMPVPLEITVGVPAHALIPDDEQLRGVSWTMPLLTRMSPAPSLVYAITQALGAGFGFIGTVRNTIDVVSFLPFPKADASEAEQFKPEFYVHLGVNAPLGKSDNFYGAVVRYGGRVVKQFVNDTRTQLVVFADPKTNALFSAEGLVNLSAAELAATPHDAGVLEIFVYRIAKGFDIKLVYDSAQGAGSGSVVDFPSRGYGGVGDSRTLGMKGGDSLTRGGSFGGTRDYGRLTSGLTALPSLPPEPTVSPAAAPKEAFDVRVGAGQARERANYTSLEGYQYDSGFGVQPIRIRLIGVREASHAAAQDALRRVAAQYTSQ